MSKNLVIFGAGIAGELLAAEIEKVNKKEYNIVGFIDDFQSDKRVLDKYPVLGSQKDLKKIITEKDIQEIIIAIPSAKGETIDTFIQNCNSLKVKVKIKTSWTWEWTPTIWWRCPGRSKKN